MSYRRTAPAGLVATKFQAMSLANSTAIAINGTVRDAGSSFLLVSVAAVGVRLRADSTAPTNNTGVLLTSTGSPYEFPAYDGAATFKLNRNGGSGTALVQIQAFKRPGD